MGRKVARMRRFVIVRGGEPISYLRMRVARGAGGHYLGRRCAAISHLPPSWPPPGWSRSCCSGTRGEHAAAIVVATVPLAWCRQAPLLPLAAIAVALIADSALGGELVGQTATPLVALAIALYSVGRYAGELGSWARRWASWWSPRRARSPTPRSIRSGTWC